jgi:hypothetical protein
VAVRVTSDWTTGPCEFSAGSASLESGMPVVVLCGQPGTARRGIMWCEVYACDECYSHWLASPRRGHARTRTRDTEGDVKS